MSPATVVDTDPSAFINQQVTLAGQARDAHGGAVVLLRDRTPVYVRGVHAWDPAIDGKRIQITGTLRVQGGADEPLVDPVTGLASHGMEGDALILEDATWEEGH